MKKHFNHTLTKKLKGRLLSWGCSKGKSGIEIVILDDRLKKVSIFIDATKIKRMNSLMLEVNQ